ncbi:MAG: 6,7-dimethyl-8-ribityllumazine synthase [Gammaproteobacteria bacterium]|nr:6,7-dimethyl-8-ribityllumazine synthase [Gammaproteobacteria bacterium]MDD9871401.1 6,7-dimethyl-8-ribityllumazine synthase [Gammaproteobacteria bacterium]
MKVGIIASRFNEDITDRLLGGALRCLGRNSVGESAISVVWVPGAMEIPLAADFLAREYIPKAGSRYQIYDTLIALGCVIRGETSHYDHVCRVCADGVLRVSLRTHVPIGFGVLTVDNRAQAEARSTSGNNKGADAAQAAMDMYQVKQAHPHRRLGRPE